VRTKARSLVSAAVVAVAVAARVVVAAAPAQAVVGGTVADHRDYPYFISILHDLNQPSCGATVIAPGWLLTAAHCTHHGTAWVLGYTGNAYLASALPHPLYDGNGQDGHDLALLNVNVDATAGAVPIQVGAPWDWQLYRAGTPATIMGTGRPSPSGSSGDFRVAGTVVQSDDYMSDIFDPWYYLWFGSWNDALLIGAGTPAHTICFGDSGGPLVVYRSGKPVQVGVAGFTESGDQCGDAGAFAELSGAQLAWVASQIPAVVAGWGGCSTSTGSPGQPSVAYSTTAFPGAQRDGSYYWAITCAGQQPTITVPNLTGDSQSEAAASLQAAGLGLGSVEYAPDDRYCNDVDLVMRQTPSPGVVVPPASVVGITIGLQPSQPCL
jgi:Trypsin/PASTA domain